MPSDIRADERQRHRQTGRLGVVGLRDPQRIAVALAIPDRQRNVELADLPTIGIDITSGSET